MGKKRYFLNLFYLSICILFISLASFLNFQNSLAKEIPSPLNGDFQLEDQEDAPDEYGIKDRLKPIEEKYQFAIASSYQSTYAPAVNNYTASQPVQYSSYIDIAGRTLRIEDVNDTLIDSTDHVNRWGKKFLYGHNTAGVFGPIRNLSAGATFTVLMDGELHTYQIMYTETMEKLKVEQHMTGIAYANYGGNRYDLSLMTCAGRSLGGGDATHRFVVFANRIS